MVKNTRKGIERLGRNEGYDYAETIGNIAEYLSVDIFFNIIFNVLTTTNNIINKNL